MIKIKIPATSANIGPGFDTLGLALNLYNTFEFYEIEEGLEIIGYDDSHNNESNLIYTSMLKVFEKVNYSPKGIKIIVDGDIPISRGLGSSAACILGGVMGANELAGAPLSKDEVFKIATEIEGHPDNIAPALFGGLVVSVTDDNEIYHNRIDVVPRLKFVALIPDFTLSTKSAREVLPTNILYKDAVYNVGRVSLLISAFNNGRFDLLKVALKDRLHQPYRGRLISGFDEIIKKCYELNCLGAYLSGAGPTIMTVINKEDNDLIIHMRDYFNKNNINWDIKELDLDLRGARTEKAARGF